MDLLQMELDFWLDALEEDDLQHLIELAKDHSQIKKTGRLRKSEPNPLKKFLQGVIESKKETA